ncbi:MAG: hypothetical protein IT345_10525 [Trueperaceae bacterium]|nr:hypothetical protein [Trueperaceae bacterium]
MTDKAIDPIPSDFSLVLGLIASELVSATRKHGRLASGHESVGVIEEEFLEFRSAVFWGVDQRGNPSDPFDEAIQLAAMAVRYLIDIHGVNA